MDNQQRTPPSASRQEPSAPSIDLAEMEQQSLAGLTTPTAAATAASDSIPEPTLTSPPTVHATSAASPSDTTDIDLQLPYQKLLYLCEMFAELPVSGISTIVEVNSDKPIQFLIDKCLELNQTPFDMLSDDERMQAGDPSSSSANAAPRTDEQKNNGYDIRDFDLSEGSPSNTVTWLPPSITNTINQMQQPPAAAATYNTVQSTNNTPAATPSSSSSSSVPSHLLANIDHPLPAVADTTTYTHLSVPAWTLNLGSDLHERQSKVYTAVRNFHTHLVHNKQYDTYATALRTIDKIIINLLQDPNNDKYRLLSLSNPKLYSKVGSIPGSVDILRAVRFHDVRDTDDSTAQTITTYLLCDDHPIDANLLKYAQSLIQQELSAALRAQTAASKPASSTTAKPVDEDAMYRRPKNSFERYNKNKQSLADLRNGTAPKPGITPQYPMAQPVNYIPRASVTRETIANRLENKLKQASPTSANDYPGNSRRSSQNLQPPSSSSRSPSPSSTNLSPRQPSYTATSDSLTTPLLAAPTYDDAQHHPTASAVPTANFVEPSQRTIADAAAHGEVVQGRVTDFTAVRRTQNDIAAMRRDHHKTHATKEGVKRHFTVADLDALRKKDFDTQAKFGSGKFKDGDDPADGPNSGNKFVDVGKWGLTANDLLHVGRECLQFTNEFRAQNGLPPLQWHQSIWEVSMVHSRDMAEGRVKFGHDGFQQRVAAFPFAYSSAAENVAYNQGLPYTSVARVAVDGWINSAGKSTTERSVLPLQDAHGQLLTIQQYIPVTPQVTARTCSVCRRTVRLQCTATPTDSFTSRRCLQLAEK